jgi:D-sedoheptulose 7-phosphate isomerase
MAESDAVDHCFVVASQSIHRIQESQALLGYELWAAAQRAITHPPSALGGAA